MFIRRLYYNAETGDVLHSYMMNGDIKPISAEEEAARFGFENWSVMVWHEPDYEIEQSFVDSFGRVTVDVSGELPVLVFDFSPMPEPEPELNEYEQYYAAVSAALGVTE